MFTASRNWALFTYSGASSTFEPISGDRSAGPNILSDAASTGNPDTTFTVGPVVGGEPGEAVTAIAFTLLSRDRVEFPQNITVRATFSDDTSAEVTTELLRNKSGDDTFFAFTAPAGTSVTSFSIDHPVVGGGAGTAIDDLAFITSVVPEPGTLALAGVASLALFRRRRRA